MMAKILTYFHPYTKVSNIWTRLKSLLVGRILLAFLKVVSCISGAISNDFNAEMP